MIFLKDKTGGNYTAFIRVGSVQHFCCRCNNSSVLLLESEPAFTAQLELTCVKVNPVLKSKSAVITFPPAGGMVSISTIFILIRVLLQDWINNY